MITNRLLSLFLSSSFSVGLAAQDMFAVNFGGTGHEISSTNGVGTAVGSVGATGLNCLSSYDGQLLSVRNNGEVVSIDPWDGTSTVLVQTFPALTQVRALAVDALGNVYAAQNGGGFTTPDKLYQINMNSGFASLIGDIGTFSGVQAMTFAPDGTLYAWDVGPSLGNGQGLITVDPATGAAVDVNPAVGATVFVQSMAVSSSGQLYGVQNALFSIDRATGVGTQIGSGGLPDLRGIEFTPPPAARCTLWNGSGLNPNVCSCATEPVVGTTWRIAVATTASTALTVVFASPNELALPQQLSIGEAFLGGPLATIPEFAMGDHRWALPTGPQFLGFHVTVQGLRVEVGTNGVSIQLTNAQTGRLGQ